MTQQVRLSHVVAVGPRLHRKRVVRGVGGLEG